MCYIQQHEFSKASSVLRYCDNNEATTHYVALLVAIHQGALQVSYDTCSYSNIFTLGLEDEGSFILVHFVIWTPDIPIPAIRASCKMMQAPDFDRKMLALVTQLSHESDMKGLLLSVLDSLLQTLQTKESDGILEGMVLIRCAIKLIIRLLTDPAAQM